MDEYDDEMHINVGTGQDLSINSLAEMVRDVVYPEAELEFDPAEPDGTPRKVLDTSRINALGWKPAIELRDGIESTYRWFLDSENA